MEKNNMTHEFDKLEFCDPATTLPQLRKIQELVARSNLNDKTKNLRTNKLRKHREGWESAIFSYGMSQLLNTKIHFAPYEASDYDAVTMRKDGDEIIFTPIQIKEVVPERINPYTDINKEIEKLSKYHDICVGIHINRPGRLELSKIMIPKLKIAQLWLFGASKKDQGRWFIAGDMLNNPEILEFNYPI